MNYLFPSAAALLLLAGCGQQSPIENEEISVSPPPATTPEPTPGPRPSAPSASTDVIRLEPLQPSDVDGLKGELACGFAEKADGPNLLLGRANVGDREQAGAVVRIAGRAEQLAAPVPGGFAAMTRGLAFGGQGLTVTIERHARQGAGDESSAYHATLTAQRGDGAARTVEGLWTCGP